ncbi:MAG: DUF4097 family beta strand repeat protein [Micropruina sp.]|nr:DUF4097 family beta strand repeat protein [Micropruina sp.]
MTTTAATTHEWRFATDETPSLQLRCRHGDVRIVHDGGPGEVVVQLTAATAFEPNLIETRTQGREVFVTVPPTLNPGDTGFGFSLQVGRLSWGIGSAPRVDVEVHLSPDADIEVNATSGDIACFGRSGHAQLQTGGGDIRMEAAASAQVVTQSGDIRAESIERGELRTGCGDITVVRLGEGSVKTGGGDVRLDDLGSGRIDTSAGDVTVLRAGGDLSVHTGSGDVSVLQCVATTQVRTGAGDVTVEAASGEVTIGTGVGDIRVTLPRDVPVWQDLHSSFGEVRSRIGRRGEPQDGQPYIRVSARTGTGDVVLQD